MLSTDFCHMVVGPGVGYVGYVASIGATVVGCFYTPGVHSPAPAVVVISGG